MATDSIPDVPTGDSIGPRSRSGSSNHDETLSETMVTKPPPVHLETSEQDYADEEQDNHPEEEQEEEEEETAAPVLNTSPTSEYLQGIMAEFQKLEGKLSLLLTEHTKIKDENEDLRSQPQPDPATLQDLETLTTKYNKVKKLYFQREQQIEDLTKENEDLKAEREDLIRERDELLQIKDEQDRDLNILTKDRDTLNAEYEDVSRERDSLARQRDTITRERDTIARERDAVLRERDTIAKVKDEAIHEKQEAIIERDDAKQEREGLQNRVKDLEDDVARLQSQASSGANGVHDKRRSVPSVPGATGGENGYPQEILKLKYDKVKRLYYDQQKTISNMEDRIRGLESGNAGHRQTNGDASRKNREDDYASEFF